jgi:hypothetical protein
MSGEDPSVTDVSIEPTTLTAGQTDITISVRITSSIDVSAVTVGSEVGHGSMVLEQGGNPGSGMWTGIVPFPQWAPDGNYDITVTVVTDIKQQPNVISIGKVLLTRSAGTGMDDRLTTFTFRGPVTVRNMTSESGECEIRISVRGPVTIDCESPQK